MAKLDVMEYRDQYLKKVEERLMAKKQSIPNFTSQNLHEAVLSEMNRADTETWMIDVPDDKEKALREAESRMMESMKHNRDLGVGKGAVASK
jgi:hypothetical protein